MKAVRLSLVALLVLFSALNASATGPILLANGTLTSSSAGYCTDLSGLHGTLENGVPKTLLGGMGSGLAWAGGSTFIAIPDRGPNAVSYDSLVDDTVTYIPRFHEVSMDLEPANGALPFTLAPTLNATTLIYNAAPLVYGTGDGLGVPPGAPAENRPSRNYFFLRSV